MGAPALPDLGEQAGGLRIEGQLQVGGGAGAGRVGGRHGQHVERGVVLAADAGLAGAVAQPVEPAPRVGAQQRTGGAGEVGEVAVLEAGVAGVTPDVPEHVGVVAPHHQRPVAARGLPHHGPGPGVPERAELLLHEGDHVPRHVVAVVPDGRAVHPLAAAQRRPAVHEDAHRGGDRAGGDEPVEPLRHGEAEAREAGPGVCAAGEPVQEVDGRQAGAGARRAVEVDRPARRVAERVAAQRGCVEGLQVEAAFHGGAPGLGCIRQVIAPVNEP